MNPFRDETCVKAGPRNVVTHILNCTHSTEMAPCNHLLTP